MKMETDQFENTGIMILSSFVILTVAARWTSHFFLFVYDLSAS